MHIILVLSAVSIYFKKKEQVTAIILIFYQLFRGPRKSVSGSEKPHVLWNNIGRGRVLQMIKSHISHFQN